MTPATSVDTLARLLTFGEVTTVEPSESGRARAAISADWTVAGRAHGGYLTALLARA